MKKRSFLPYLLLFPLLAGCGGGGEGGGAGGGSSARSISLDTVVNVTKIKRGFIISTQEAEEVVDYSKYGSLASMSAAGVYYLVYDFDYYSRKETSGDLVLTAALEFDMITIFSAMLLESDSGADGTPISFIDSATNRMHNRIVQTFRIPEEADVTKHQQVVFRITPTAVGESSMRMRFIVDDPNVRVVGDGAEGCTVPMVVQEYKIETPVPVYDTNLHWPHVKGANYYKVKLNGNYIKGSDGADLRVEVDEKLSIGTQVILENLALYGYGDNLPVVVEAYGLKAGVTQSDPSTPIYVNL